MVTLPQQPKSKTPATPKDRLWNNNKNTLNIFIIPSMPDDYDEERV